MKKSILMIAFVIATLSTVSCNKKEATETKSEQATEKTNAETSKKTFECPMDCEKGKTYDAKGTCPKCNMELIEVNADAHKGHGHSADEHKGHDHSKENHEGHDH